MSTLIDDKTALYLHGQGVENILIEWWINTGQIPKDEFYKVEWFWEEVPTSDDGLPLPRKLIGVRVKFWEEEDDAPDTTL